VIQPVLAGRGRRAVAVQLAILYVPVLQGPFDTEVLEPVQLAFVLAASTAVELEKWVIRRRSRRSHHSGACWPFCVAPDASRLLLGG